MRIGTFLATLRASSSRCVAEVGATNLFLLLVLAVFTIYPLLSVGYVNTDDGEWAYIKAGDIWKRALAISETQGRFNFLWVYPLGWIPYAIDNRVWYLAWKFGTFLLFLSALYYAISQIFRSSWVALASLVFFLAFIQNGWEYQVLTAVPVLYNAIAVMFLVSLGLFSAAIDRRNLALAGLAGGLYFFALGVELFVLFFPCYLAVVLSRGVPGEAVTRKLISARKYILAVALPLIVYLALYLLWRSIHPSIYDGNQLDGTDLRAAGKVIATLSLAAFPLASLHFIVSPGDQLQLANSAGLRAILSGLNAASYIKPAVVGLLLARLMTTARFGAPPVRRLLTGAGLAIVGIFLPNLLLGFSRKYQSLVAGGMSSYVYTYYSFVSAVLLAALILACLNAMSRPWHPKLRMLLMFAVVTAIMAVSFPVEVRNQYIAFDQKLSHRKWQLMDAVIKSPTFMDIPDGSNVYAPTLFAPQRGIHWWAPAKYWSGYIKYKTGKEVRFVDDKCNSGAPCYSLVFRQVSHADDQFIVLAKIKKPDSLVSSDLTIYSMPPQTRAVLVGSFVPEEVVPRLLMDGAPLPNVGNGLFSSNLPHASGAGPVQTARVTGNVDILPERITISHYGIEPRMQPLSAELAEGIDFTKQEFPDFLLVVSGMSGYEQWGRWTDAAAGRSASFRFKQALPRKFTLEITANAFGPNNGEPVKVRAGGIEKTFVITTKKEADTYRLAFETDGAADVLEITPPKPTSPNEIDPKNGDSRKLGIALYSLKIKVQTPKS